MTEIKRSLSVVIVFLAVIIAIPFLRSPKTVKALESRRELSIAMNMPLDADNEIKLPYYPTAHDSVTPDSGILAPDAENSPLEADMFGIAYTLSDTIDITDAELELIAATVQLEVLGKYSTADQFENPDLKYFEMLAVAQVIRNRLLSDSFPSDIKTVICASEYKATGRVYQFSTSPYLSSTNPSELAYTAAREVFGHGVTVLPEDYLYFCATWRESAFQINNRAVLKYIGEIGDFDKIVADATTFYAGVTMEENIKSGYVF